MTRDDALMVVALDGAHRDFQAYGEHADVVLLTEDSSGERGLTEIHGGPLEHALELARAEVSAFEAIKYVVIFSAGGRLLVMGADLAAGCVVMAAAHLGRGQLGPWAEVAGAAAVNLFAPNPVYTCGFLPHKDHPDTATVH